MSQSSIDYKYSLDFLKRINSFVEKDEYLKNIFIYRGYNLWQANQSSVLGDIKNWSKNKNLDTVFPRTNIKILIKILITTSAIGFISVFSVLFFIFSRRKVIVFTSDKISGKFNNDFRLDTLYKALNKNEEKFIEIVHTIPGKSTFKNFFIRQRPVIYLEAPDSFSFLEIRREKIRFLKKAKNFDLKNFNNEERYFLRILLSKYVTSKSIFKWRCIFVRFLFNFSNVKELFCIDDVRHYNEIMLEAKEKKIKTYAIQHGHFTKYHTGWLKMTGLPGKIIKPDQILVWSDYWKEQLLILGTYFNDKEIVVAGEVSFKIRNKSESSNKRIILIPYETDAPKGEVVKYIKEIIKKEFIVAFKIRSDIPKEEQKKEYDIEESERVLVIENLDQILPDVKAVLGVYSTFLYDCVKDLIPVGIFETSMDYGQGMVDNHLANIIRFEKDLNDQMVNLINTPQEVLIKRKDKLIGQSEGELSKTLELILKSNV